MLKVLFYVIIHYSQHFLSSLLTDIKWREIKYIKEIFNI